MICGTGRELCLAKHDGHKAYLEAVEGAGVDCAQL
jgi:hypothetical protein